MNKTQAPKAAEPAKAKKPWEMTADAYATRPRETSVETGWRVNVRYLDNPAGPNRGSDTLWQADKPAVGSPGTGPFGRYLVKSVARERPTRVNPRFSSEFEQYDFYRQQHRAAVEQALRENRPIPPEVLADYAKAR